MKKSTYLDMQSSFRKALLQLGEATPIRQRTMITISPVDHPHYWHRLMLFGKQTLASLGGEESIEEQLLVTALDQLMCNYSTDAISCLERLITHELDVLDRFVEWQSERYQMMFALPFTASLKMAYAELFQCSLHGVDKIRRAVCKDDYLDEDAIFAAINPN